MAVILFRESYETKDEKIVAAKHFPVVESRMDIPHNSLVIARYSALPFYHELERDLSKIGSKLINSRLEHQYVANFDYYEDVAQYTFPTWFELKDVPKNSGPWVVKGRTNSRKFQWKEMMFAETWEQLVQIWCTLQSDPLIGPQGLVVRKYIPLKFVSESVSGPPHTNEWRFFAYQGTLLTFGYYWSSSDVHGKLTLEGMEFAKQIADRIADNIPFACIDIAETADNKWMLVELNDGQMAGLSEAPADFLYTNLSILVS